jgi:cell wall-associated NlpC family hydrolase
VFPDGWLGTAPKEFRAFPLKPTRDNILLFAKQFLGVPYLWGGKSVLGVDCSGLVQSVFRSVGIELPRDGSQQAVHFSDYKISLNTVKSGDLLFFGRNDSISHVAISLGGLNILHSQGWVKEESLDKFHANFNEKLLNIFQFSSSVEHLMIP